MTEKRNCTIYYRDGGHHQTQIDVEKNSPISVGQRMAEIGFLVCVDDRWDGSRTIIVNLSDVKAIVIE